MTRVDHGKIIDQNESCSPSQENSVHGLMTFFSSDPNEL